MRPAPLLIFLLCLFLLFGNSILVSSEEDLATKEFQLDNGLKVFFHKKQTFPLVNISIGVDLGSKDESEETNGFVHILEHCVLFRGTETRKGFEIIRQVRENGAYLNAHTGHDLSIFEIALPSERIEFGLLNLKDILFRFNADQDGLDQEKEIILEEINQIKDDPLRQATSLVYQHLFPDDHYQRPIYGKEEIVRAATAEGLKAFHKSFFVPSNCVMAVVGDFDLSSAEEMIRDIFEEIPDRAVKRTDLTNVRPLEKDVELSEEMDVMQAYLVLGVQGPEFGHPDKVTMDVLTDILRNQIRSHINRKFPSRRSILHSVSMSYNAMKFGGAILVHMRLEPDHVETVRREAIRFLKSARNLNYSRGDYPSSQAVFVPDLLENSLNQIRFNAHQFNEEGLLIATSLVHYIILNGKLPELSYIEQVSQIDSIDLRAAAGKYLSSNKFVSVSILPEKKQKKKEKN